MKKSMCLAICLVGVFVLAAFTAPVPAEELWSEKWWPSKWGADDEKGSFNTITPQKVLSAVQLVKTGKRYRLGMPYQQKMPLFGNRTYALHIPGLPVGGPLGKNNVIWNDEFIAGELGQVGTQFDGPGHVGISGPDGVHRWYNGAELATAEHTYGLKKNGIEKLGSAITRGVLVDVAGLKGVKSMKQGEVITVADIEAALEKAGIAPIGEGDAVLFNTGWIEHWDDPATFNAGCPGIGIEAAKYLIEKNVSMLAADTWPIEVIPGEDPDRPFLLHTLMQTVHGIWFLENLDLRKLAEDKVYEFLFIFVPVPFAGATGSPGDAIAIK